MAVALGLAMVFAVLAAGVAVADHRFNEINCENRDLPCNGTNDRDLMHERQGTVKDVMYGKDGKDVLDANNFNFDRDRLYGGDSADKILANDGHGRDVATGGAGRDISSAAPPDRPDHGTI